MSPLSDDAEDLTLPQRPRRPELRPEARAAARAAMQEDLAPEVEQDREFTLSTGTVLALFFGLALICAIFFGFGYSMGRKSAPLNTAETTATGDATAPSAAEAAASKPAAGSPAIQAIPGYLSQNEADAANRNAATQTYKASSAPASSKNATPTTVTVPIETATSAPKPKKPAVDPDSQIVEAPKPAPVRPTPAASPAPVQTMNAGTPVASGTGSTYVQIAAVSHKEDADVLLSALRRRGYSVFTKPGDADKLIHVQVGPFPTKKDAETMRQRLLGDGYNAILK